MACPRNAWLVVVLNVVRSVCVNLGSPMNDIANFARYENCTFIGNRANYNSAVSLVTVDTLNTQLSHRPVEMVNW